MAYFESSNFFDGSLNYVKNNCDKIAIISAYTFGDSYATVTANILAEVTMTSSDFTIGSSGNNRTITTASGKQDSSANATGNANHFAFLKTTATTEVILVIPETSQQLITIGNPVNFQSIVYTAHQPTA
jgi:hypothetical protein